MADASEVHKSIEQACVFCSDHSPHTSTARKGDNVLERFPVFQSLYTTSSVPSLLLQDQSTLPYYHQQLLPMIKLAGVQYGAPLRPWRYESLRVSA
eukprot:5882837-Pleurochrysis_carterae.AAC.1